MRFLLKPLFKSCHALLECRNALLELLIEAHEIGGELRDVAARGVCVAFGLGHARKDSLEVVHQYFAPVMTATPPMRWFSQFAWMTAFSATVLVWNMLTIVAGDVGVSAMTSEV